MSRAIEYIWKCRRPKSEAVARALMWAAWQTAIQTEEEPVVVLIRSLIHNTTRRNGVYVKDKPHITIGVKNPQTARDRQHQASHGYTSDVRSYKILDVKPGGFIKSDEDDNAWPQEMYQRPKDTFTGPPPLLGPESDFVVEEEDESKG